LDGFSPVRGKCHFWREQLDADDVYNTRVKKGDRRVRCSCFIEGRGWTYTIDTLAVDCPDRYHCRYYIHNY
jgi:hypothetical protein